MALDVTYRSIPDMFRRRVAATPDRDALGHPTPDEGIAWLTWTQADKRVTAIAAGLIGLGVAPGDRVAILCGTRVEWILADFGINCAGAATTAIYPTTEPDEAVFIVRDSGSKVLIAENAAQAAKVAEADLAHVVVIDGDGDLTLAELERLGAAALQKDPGLVDRVIDTVGPDQLATLIYTSGTTGRPKGVELTHAGWCWEGVAQCEPGLLQDGGTKAKIFNWAVRAGKRAVELELGGQRVPPTLAAQRAVADRLVFTKLRARLGGNIRILCSGAAPLSKDIALFFAAARLPLMEGYGLSESSAGNFVNRPGRLKVGTVGQPLGDLQCRIDTDGEILLRGAPVMRGYHNLPDQTAEVFTEDGFFRTGDIGELDADGYLRITDRKKDLIKTSGGKYVSPTHIEGLFRSICPYTSQVLVIGQARNYCTMLVTLDPDAIAKWAAGGPLSGRSYAEIATAPETHELVEGYVKELNSRLNRWETVKRFTILPRDLSIEDGELTPSMKIKRRIVEKSFAPQIEELYAGTVAQL